MIRTRYLKLLLFLVIGASFWPVLFGFKLPEVKIESRGLATITLSSTNLVPFVIAASFTRITDADNNLIMNTRDTDKVSTRERVFALVEENPGIHFRDICRRLNKEIGCVQYHVYILKKFGLVSTMRDGRYTRYYAKESMYDDISKLLIACWHRPVEKQILSELIAVNGSGVAVQDIVAKCEVTSQAITWHVNRLQERGLIVELEDKNITLAKDARDALQTLLDFRVVGN